MKKKSLRQNTLILTIPGFIVKIIGFVYRIYIANSIGAEGMGLYQLVLPVYNLVLLGLTAGVGIAVSRLVAEETAKGKDNNSKRIAFVAGSATFIAAVIIVSLMMLNLDFFVNIFVGDIRTKTSLMYLLPAIPFIAAMTSLKGYFYGIQEVVPNALSQIAEQITKLFVIIAIADIFSYGDFERKCLFATIGLISGELANVIVVYIAFILKRKPIGTAGKKSVMRKRDIGKSILKISLPIAANRLILSLLGTVEFILIPQRLAMYGFTTTEALSEYGKLTGMAAPVVYFPSMLTGALATALVPAIAEAVAMKRITAANRQISRSIRLTLVFGFLFTSLFVSFSTDIADLIYPGQNVGPMLFLLSFTGVFLYVQQTLLGVLNGLGKETITLKHSMITSILRLGFVWFAIPVFGIYGYIASLLLTSIIGSVLNLRTATKTTGMSLEIGDWLIKPLIASLSGAIAAPVIKTVVSYAVNNQALFVVLSAGITGCIMLSILILTGVLEIKDLKQVLPFHIEKYRRF
ncbi:MAG: polysaccharide biosynthesis protein [Clostridiaceae bacterium]|nr:polysaccharide biosynthesis protein [Clostridiaceae bacterium]